MKIRNIWLVYFSPTGNTEKIAEAVARGCAESGGQFEKLCRRDITLPPEREKTLSFCGEDLVVFAMPTYAGRLPNKIMPFVRDRVQGEGALAVPVVTYGNRSADDSLMELNLLLRVNGFRTLLPRFWRQGDPTVRIWQKPRNWAGKLRRRRNENSLAM